jgi:hypothetical protein
MTTTDDLDSVNHVIDLKGPLKGKGGSLAQWRADCETRLQEVYAAMAQLASESASIEGRRFGLHVYKLRDARQLRWRLTNSRHATWKTVEPMLGVLSPGLSDWYRQAEEVAQVLNHREQVLRYEFKTVERLKTVGARGAHYSYTQTVGRGVGGGRPSHRKSPSNGSEDVTGAVGRGTEQVGS